METPWENTFKKSKIFIQEDHKRKPFLKKYAIFSQGPCKNIAIFRRSFKVFLVEGRCENVHV